MAGAVFGVAAPRGADDVRWERTGLGSPEALYLGSEDGVMEKQASSKWYPHELKERAVRTVKELRQQDPG